MKIGIIGYGVVGKAVEFTLSKKYVVLKYDKYFNSDSFESLLSCQFVFVTVPTPFDLENGRVDDSAVHETLENLQKKNFENIVVIKSTIPPGSNRRYLNQYKLKIVFNPEFLRESKSPNEDFCKQHCVVIGTQSSLLFDSVRKMYEAVLRNDCSYHEVSYEAAELIKYSQNMTLSSRVAIANIVYDACEKYSVPYDLLKTIAFDSFEIVGPHMVEVPGPDGLRGFGGKCLPKDLLGFNTIHNSRIVEAIIDYNNKLRSKSRINKNEEG